MTSKKIRGIGAAVLAAIWIVLTGFAWLQPAKEMSLTERRALHQMPELNLQTLANGNFMSKFEDYTTDQFPMRDVFRQLKAIFHYNVMQQSDNNDLYCHNGYLAEMEYPLDEAVVNRSLGVLTSVYEMYLKDSRCKVYQTVVPDKGYYLAQPSGHLAMDYESLFAQAQQAVPGTFVDLTPHLQIKDYYYTDTHWRQEKLIPVAQALCQAMGVTAPQEDQFQKETVQRPFYGVYHGQVALPVPGEEMVLMNNQLLNRCKVFNVETNRLTKVYDKIKLNGEDMYEVYLSGTHAMLRIENPTAKTGKHLVIFRDSFGSALAPLLLADYETVTLVDLRHVAVEEIGKHISFTNQDVLFMYSSLVLNKGIK